MQFDLSIIESYTMESNEILRNQVFEILNNQLRSKNPPEVKETYDRLIMKGHDDIDVRKMLGQCLMVELFDVLKFQKPFDLKRYVKNLRALPKEPFE